MCNSPLISSNVIIAFNIIAEVFVNERDRLSLKMTAYPIIKPLYNYSQLQNIDLIHDSKHLFVLG